jgi:YD repeat-containing protein
MVEALPDAQAAMAAAQRQGSHVEVLNARTATNTTFAEPDGTLTTTASTAPVRVQSADGSWQDIDTTLTPNGSGGWTPAVAVDPLTVSAGGVGSFATLNPAGAGKVALSWPTKLPAPQVSGSTATYSDVQPGVDLVVQALPDGFSEQLVIKQRPAAGLDFALPMALGGATASVAPDGSVDVTSTAGQIATAPTPLMWDSSPASDGTSNGEPVDVAVTTVAGTPTLDLSPSTSMLQDPNTVYPVVVDPTFTSTASGDSWMQNPDITTAQQGSTELRAGTSDAGAHVARSFIHFRAAEKSFAGAKINSATLTLRNWASSTCTGSAIQVQQITQDWSGSTMTWANQPTVTSTNSDTYTPAYGASGCAAAGTATWNIGPLVQTWADGTPNYGLRVSAVNETDSNSWRQYRSMNYSVTTEQPTLTVNYNSYPSAPDNLTWTPRTSYTSGSTTTNYVTKVTPWLYANVNDPEQGQVAARYTLLEGSTTLLNQVWGSTVASGQVSSYHVPTGQLVDGHTYTVQAITSDLTLQSKNNASTTFTVDLTSPATPTVSSSTFASNAWTYGSTSGSFTFTDTSSDVVGWRYSFDHGSTWTTIAGGTSTTTTITPPAGWDQINVQAVDKAGRTSPSTTYTFGANASMDSPTDQQVTPQLVALSGTGPSTATGVTFKYRLPGATTWTNIPVADVTNTSTNQHITSWPVNVKAGSDSHTVVPSFGMNWNVLSTRGNADGAIQVEASFTGGTTRTTAAATVTVDRKSIGGDNASEPIGPGSISLLTGAFSYDSTEGEVSRVFNSNDTATTGQFGPGWTTSLPAGWVSLSDQGSSVVVTGSDGSTNVFAKNPGGGYIGQDGAVDLILTSSGTGNSMIYKLSTSDGANTTFGWNNTGTFQTSPTVASPNVYRVLTYVDAGSHATPGALTTRYTYNTSGTYLGLPKEIFDPPADGHDCSTTWSSGCHSLQITYTGASLATARVQKVTMRAVDASGTTQTFDIGCYTYDASNRLQQAWDPRTASATCNFASPVLPTGYGYDASNRITSITPPGQATWNVGYDATGRVSTISRTHNAIYGSGTVTTTLAYNVPIGTNSTNPDYNPDLTSTARKTWAQNALPATATAVFPPGSNVSATDLRDATVHVLDLDGREINTAGYSGTGQAGWKIATTEYDTHGNVTRTLTPANRDLALADSSTTVDQLGLPTGATSDDLARALDTRNIYSGDGIDLIDTFGPVHVVQLPDRTLVAARQHTHNTYGTVDMTAPTPTLPTDPTTGGPLHAVIQTDESASISPDPVATAETDTRTTRYAYALSTTDTAGWYLGTPERVTTVVSGGTDIVHEARYDATTGQQLEVRQPSAAGTNGNNAGTTKFVYYTVGTNPADAACGNKPAWSGLLCTQGPGAQPGVSGLPGLPVKRDVAYDIFGRPTTVTATVTDASGAQIVRTSVVTYDGPSGIADRLKAIAVTGGTGAAVPTLTYGYSATTGLGTTTTADSSAGAGLAGTLARGYDDFGADVTFTDADNAQTVTGYDAFGRPSTITLKQPDGSTLNTTTLGYNGSTERRGLVTSISYSSLTGTFSGSYDSDGQLSVETWPDGLTTNYSRDPSGAILSVTDSKSGNIFLSDQQDSNIHGEWTSESGALLPFARAYLYDGAGRLTRVSDTSTDPLAPGCTTRTYAFDADSNRTSRIVYPPASDASCSTLTTPTSSTSYSFDGADRLQPTGIHAGLTYDTFGRITSLPAADSNGTVSTLNYYTTDVMNSIMQGNSARQWTLDPGMRLRKQTAESGNGQTVLNHYSSDSGAPTWTVDTTPAGATTTSTTLIGLDGQLAAISSVGGGAGSQWQLIGLHGDVERTTSPSATLAPDGALIQTDEFGVTSSTAKYGYLAAGGSTRDDLAGLNLVGGRIYAPLTGQFLQGDHYFGGNVGPYSFGPDPTNNPDTSGGYTAGSSKDCATTHLHPNSLLHPFVVWLSVCLTASWGRTGHINKNQAPWEDMGKTTLGSGFEYGYSAPQKVLVTNNDEVEWRFAAYAQDCVAKVSPICEPRTNFEIYIHWYAPAAAAKKYPEELWHYSWFAMCTNKWCSWNYYLTW